MFRHLRGYRAVPYLTAAVVVVLVIGGGLAIAASGGGGVIHGCSAKNGGALRIAAKCTRHERSVSWNRQGPRGVPGPRGAQGLRGLTGAQGPQGNTGAPGPFPGTLPAGETLRGNYNIGGTAAAAGALANTAISFVFQFASAPAFNYIPPGGASTAACPGSAANPSAAPGNLCVYSQGVLNTTGAQNNNVDRWGDTLFIFAAAPGTFYDYGIWAATSP